MLIIDAGALLDLIEVRSSIVQIAASHLGPLQVPAPALERTAVLDEKECNRLGITIFECTIEQILEAGQRRAGTSFEDRICLIVARDRHWTLITNDTAQRKTCYRDGVLVINALDLILRLQRALHLSVQDAIRAANTLHEVNPRQIKKEHLANCLRNIEADYQIKIAS